MIACDVVKLPAWGGNGVGCEGALVMCPLHWGSKQRALISHLYSPRSFLHIHNLVDGGGVM